MVHGIVDVAAQVEDQVFAGDAHQVTTDVTDVVGRIVVTHVGVDRGQALGDRTGAVQSGLVDQLDVQSGLLVPAHDLERRAAARHATADQEDVDFLFNDFGITESEFGHV